MDKQTIIDKIKKLIALRDGAQAIGSEAEANAAAAAIQRLLTQYNLEMAEVYQSAATSEKEESPIGRSNGLNTADPYRCGWKQDLLNVLCKHYYSKGFMVKGTCTMCVYGTDVNRMAVEYAFNFLTTVFSGLMPRRYKEHFAGCRVLPRQRDLWAASYLLGCVSGVRDKLEKEKAAEETCTALTVCHQTMIEHYLKDQGQKAGQWKSGARRMLDENAYSIGEKDGRKQRIAKALK